MRIGILSSGLLLACLAVVQSAVVGIDMGSEFIKVSLVRPGSPFHIVVDEQAKRKIPAVVAFDKNERAFGNNAMSLVVRKAKRAYLFPHRLLGKTLDSPEVKQMQEFGYPYKFVELPGRPGAVGIQHDAETIYSPEELTAMILEYIQTICVADAGGVNVKDVVITVPSYWTQNERESLMNAAELAGLNVLSLINQNTAAAVQYGIDRKYNETDPDHNIVIYNMGSLATEATLVTYNHYQHKISKKKNQTVGQFEVKAVASDAFLGGSAFDHRISKFLVEEWNKQHPKADFAAEIRPMAKIRKQAADVKKVLSANKETPVFIQSLFNDVDFKSFITRDTFYELSQDLIDRVLNPIKKVLEETNMEPSDIDALVIVGGSVRIPAVKQQLKDFFGKELTQSLNGDEAMAQGAVFRAANLSTAFKVRKLGMSEITPYPVGIRIAEMESETEEATETEEKKFSKRAQLFKRNNRLAKRKTVAFTHDKDFNVSMHYDSAQLLPEGASRLITYYNVSGLADVAADEKNVKLLEEQKPRVALSFSLSSSGVVNLVKAEATLEEEIQVAVPKKKAPKKNATVDAEASETEEGKKTEEEDKNQEKEEGAEKSDESEQPTESEEDADTKETKEEEETKEEQKEEEKQEEGEEEEKKEGEDEEKKEEEEVEYRTEKKTHRFPLKFSTGFQSEIVQPMTRAMMKNATKLLKSLKERDQLTVRIAEAKNKLESAIYEIRGQMYEDEVEEVSTEEQRDAVTSLLSEVEEWLYDQNDDEYEKFETKYADILALADPIFERMRELTDRPQAINQTLTLLNYTRGMVEDFQKNKPWIPEEDLEKLVTMVDEVEGWLGNKTKEQEGLELHEEPAFKSKQLLKKLNPIAKYSKELLKRRKPAEKKPKKAKKNATESASNETQNEQEEKSEDEKVEEKAEEDKTEEKEAPEAEAQESTEETLEGKAEETAKEEL